MALAVVFLPGTARGHKVSAVSLVTEIDTVEQTIEVEFAMEIEPTGDPTIDDQITPEQAARTFATEALIAYFDDEALEPGEPEIRVIDESDEATPEDLRRKKVVATVLRDIPEGSENFLMYVEENTEAAVVMVVIKDGQAGRRLQVLYPGEFSRPVNVEPVIDGDPFSQNDPDGEGETVETPAESGGPPAEGAPVAGEMRDSKTAVGFPVVAIGGFLALVAIATAFFVFFQKSASGDSNSE